MSLCVFCRRIAHTNELKSLLMTKNYARSTNCKRRLVKRMLHTFRCVHDFSVFACTQTCLKFTLGTAFRLCSFFNEFFRKDFANACFRSHETWSTRVAPSLSFIWVQRKFEIVKNRPLQRSDRKQHSSEKKKRGGGTKKWTHLCIDRRIGRQMNEVLSSKCNCSALTFAQCTHD